MIGKANTCGYLSDDLFQEIQKLSKEYLEDEDGTRYPLISAGELEKLSIRKGTLTDKERRVMDKFVGDATMAFWGAPLPQEDFVMNAALAALEMVKGSEKLSEELQKKYGRTVSFGVGIHVGPAVVGNTGAKNRMDYTAIGDTVNTAARLEANAPAGMIYISRQVADELLGRIRTTSLGTGIHLKGKTDGFEILTLDGLAERANS